MHGKMKVMFRLKDEISSKSTVTYFSLSFQLSALTCDWKIKILSEPFIPTDGQSKYLYKSWLF